MSTHITPPCVCLYCGKRLDRMSPVAGNPQPHEGAVTICIRCGAVMRVSANLTPEGFSDEEIAEITQDPEWMAQIAKIVRAVHFVRHQKG